MGIATTREDVLPFAGEVSEEGLMWNSLYTQHDCNRGVHRIELRPFNPTVYKTSWPESDPIRDTNIVVQSDPVRTRGLESDPIQSGKNN